MIVVAQAEALPAVPFLCDRDGMPNLKTRESDARLGHILSGLRAVSGCEIIPAIHDSSDGDDTARVNDLVTAVHDPAYLAFLASVDADEDAEPQLEHPFTAPGLVPDTPVVAGMYRAGLSAAATVIAAADRLTQDVSVSYALCRPPGHHAGPNWLGGYCFLNNAAIAVAALRARGHQRMAVLDLDFHFGDGTAALLDRDDSTLFASLHCSTETSYPYRSVVSAHERQHFYSFAVSPSHDTYLDALAGAIAAAQSWQSEAYVISLGYDIIAGDPHGGWGLAPTIFDDIGRAIANIGRPTLIVQEGGYRLDQLAACSRALGSGITASAAA